MTPTGKQKSLRKKKDKLKKVLPRSAIIDHLTGLYNRRYFDRLLKKIITESKKTKNQFSLVMIDINNFKEINDRYGHLAGDRILIDVAKILKKSVRRADICFRYGGDEITIILPQAKKEVAEQIAVRLKTKVEAQTFSVTSKDTLHIRLSMGLAFFPDDGLKSEVLISRADKALYKVKRQKQRRAEPFILLTKLTPPVLKETVVSRPHLFSMLKENCTKKLMCIVADAGYGKTTLLTQFINDHKLSCVFYDLEQEDSDIIVFLFYLLHGFEQLQPGSVQRTRGLLEQGPEVVKNYELIMGTLINELVEKCKGTIFLILDDYHTITDDSMVHRALDYFIDNLPDTVRVILASRTTPCLPNLSRWRSKQDLFELTRDNLRFTHEEVTSLLTGVYKLILSDEELRNVANHTEGWITGIQLIFQSVGKDRKTVRETLNGYLAAQQSLFDYFANEVLIRESLELQNFLKFSSILEVMTPEACKIILGVKNATQLLITLERRNLFVSVVGKDKYKYHHLFRTFLQGRIVDTTLKKSLNLKSAQYYRKNGQLENSIQHYLEAESFEQAGKLIVTVVDRMKTQARFAKLDKWLKQIPEDVCSKQPHLLLTQANLRMIQGNLQEAERIYAKAEQLFRNKKVDKVSLIHIMKERGSLLWMNGSYEKALKILSKSLRKCPASEAELKAKILNLTGIVWQSVGELKKARAYLLRAYRIASHYKTASVEQNIAIGHNLAFLLFSQGEVRLAFKSFESIIKQIANNYRFRTGISFANAARVAIAFGRVDWAEQCLDKGWTLCRPYEDPWSRTALHIGYGELYIQKAQWNLAEQHLQKGLNGATKLQWQQTEFAALKTISNLYRYSGDMTKAEEYSELTQQKVDDMKNLRSVYFMTELGLLQVSLGQLEKAEQTVKISMKLIHKFGRKLNEFLSYLVFAAVNVSKDREREAMKFLRRAVRLSKIKGFDGILVREFRHMPQLIDFAQKHGIEKNYLSSLNLAHMKPEIQIIIQCFGGLQIKDEKGMMLHCVWPTEKTQSLFAFLVTHRETPVRREMLIEMLWPGFPKDRASINFRTTATRMRQTISKVFSRYIDHKQIFICQHGKYQLLPSIQFHVDAEEFTLLLNEAERTSSSEEKARIIEQALNLYKGDYLPEIYDSWTDVPRRSLRERRLRALHWSARYASEKGNDLGCIAACELYLTVEPLLEEIAQLYMVSLAHIGRLAAVKAYYTSFQQKLRKELHSYPSDETQELYRSLLQSQLAQ
jgi:LuxR family maltose regulon positive regulatory protein